MSQTIHSAAPAHPLGLDFAADIRFGAVVLEAHHSPTAFLTIQGVRR